MKFFRKSTQFPKPFLGLSWEEFSIERKEVNGLIRLINDYKITSDKSFVLHPTSFFRVLDVTKRIDKSLSQLDKNSSANEPLRKMRTSCHKFLQETISMDVTYKQQGELYRNFVNTIRIQCAVLIDNFWIEIDENFEELEINTSLV